MMVGASGGAGPRWNAVARARLAKPRFDGQMRGGALVLVLWASVAGAPAWAVDQAQLARCLAMTELKPRLACYDGLGRASVPDQPDTPAGAAKYPIISLLDLKVDRERLLGRGVITSGRLNVQGQMILLRMRDADNTPLNVSIDRLTSEKQREVRVRCTPSCIAAIKGKVVHVAFGIGLAAEKVGFEKDTP